MVWRQSAGGVNELMLTSPVVGVFPDAKFAEERTCLGVGDLLLLYTDGIMEARRGGEIFGRQAWPVSSRPSTPLPRVKWQPG
jgi:serine phosphatase RsbU (regulator of sigma subunit)